jgi:hypothetical protein
MVTSLQTSFLRALELRLPPEQSLNKAIAEHLNLSPSSAYRKSSGAIALTLDEMALLAQLFDISLDQLLFEKNDLYYNESMYTNNLIMAASDTTSMVLSTLDNPNFLLSTDTRMTQHVRKWFDKLERQSIRISGSNEKHRSNYFKSLKKRMEQQLE